MDISRKNICFFLLQSTYWPRAINYPYIRKTNPAFEFLRKTGGNRIIFIIVVEGRTFCDGSCVRLYEDVAVRYAQTNYARERNWTLPWNGQALNFRLTFSHVIILQSRSACCPIVEHHWWNTEMDRRIRILDEKLLIFQTVQISWNKIVQQSD